MLVLSRKAGEGIELPEVDVAIRVLGVKKSKVQLGIEAPREITVSRSELPARVRASGEKGDAEGTIAELTRLQGELIALGETVANSHGGEPARIVSAAIERVTGILSSIRLASPENPRPISPWVAVCSERIDPLPPSRTEDMPPGQCVRQATANYALYTAGVA